MSYVAIRNALEARLALIDGVDGVDADRDIQWPNIEFQPEAGRAYMRPDLLPAATESPTLGRVESVRESGIFQVSLFHPVNEGTIAIGTRAEAVRALFPKALELVSGGVRVTITRRASVGPTLPDNGWIMLPVSIPYFSNVFA